MVADVDAQQGCKGQAKLTDKSGENLGFVDPFVTMRANEWKDAESTWTRLQEKLTCTFPPEKLHTTRSFLERTLFSFSCLSR